jgi:hypothetical protein
MIKVAEADRAIVAAQEYARDRGYSISVTGQLLPQLVLAFEAEKNLT